jgi:hypothetical protein
MQKIQSYLYPNRIQLVINLDEFSTNNQVEWRIVYQRTIKIYKGIDNVLEIDVKNNDQKRVSLSGKTVYMVIFDQANNEIIRYTALNLEDDSSHASRGLARITVLASDLEDLIPQYLTFVVYTEDDILNNIELLYGDSKYGARGTIELLNGINARPGLYKKYDNFRPETNYQTNQTHVTYYYSDPIAVKFYQAVPTIEVALATHVTNFIGTIEIQATNKDTIGHEAFNKPSIQSQTFTNSRSTPIMFTNIDVSEYTYLRIKYTKITGTVDYAMLTA